MHSWGASCISTHTIVSHQDNLLDVQAIILANLCVCYVMNTDNEKAEELLRSIGSSS